MNKSTSFQLIGGAVLFDIPLHFSPAFLTVWGRQAEREAVFLNTELLSILLLLQ